MADSAAAGVAESTTNVTIQASFDMIDPPSAGSIAALLQEDSIERRRVRQDSPRDNTSSLANMFSGRGSRIAAASSRHYLRYNPHTAIRALIVASRNNHERIPACTFQCRSRARS